MSSASATAPAIEADIVTELKSAFADYQIFEKRGLAFGQRLYELRAKSSAQGNHEGKGFLPLLQQAGIPQRTAYYWIHSYEISIGEREPKEEKPVEAVSRNVTPQAEPTQSRELLGKKSFARSHQKPIPEYGRALQELRRYADQLGIRAQVTHTMGKFSVTVSKAFENEKDVRKFLRSQQ